VVDDGGTGADAISLIASYDAALQALAQEVETQPPPVDLSAELLKQIEAAGLIDCCSALVSQVAEMQKQLEALNLLPPPAQGTVTAVTATAPVVSSGGIAPDISLASGYGDTQNPYAAKTANFVLAGPTAGAAAVPTFRALVAADIPALPYGTGTVTSVSVVSANGFAGTVATATTTPAITLTTSISGVLYGNGTALAAATISAPLAYSAGTLSITQSSGSTDGYLSLVSQSLSGLTAPFFEYDDVPTTTSGLGTGIVFVVVSNSGIMTEILHYPGSGFGYNIGDIVTIEGSDMGGQGSVILKVINVLPSGFLINLGGDNYSAKWYDLVIDGTSPTSFSNANDLLLTLFS
jgi:hypothetical protein